MLFDEADVFVTMDSLIAVKPVWLSDFEDSKSSIKNSEGKMFKVYRKRYPKGAMIILGKNGILPGHTTSMYTVIVNSVSSIEPAYDLKPVINYKAINAVLQGPGIMKGVIDGKDRVIFNKASDKNILEWEIVVGVADTYSLAITYNNPLEQTIVGKLQFFAADGTLMKEEAIAFTSTRPGKSNYINSSTGTMINAGSYKVRLTSQDAEGISINALDVQ